MRKPDSRGYFGSFGGRFVPEVLVEPLVRACVSATSMSAPVCGRSGKEIDSPPVRPLQKPRFFSVVWRTTVCPRERM